MNNTLRDYSHTPVLLRESIEGLNIHPSGIYVDMTYGGGGHSKEILKRIDCGHLYAFDQDISVLGGLPEEKNFTFTHCNFRYAINFLRYLGVSKIDGILVDLGVSSFHFDNADRGFSLRYNEVLDMRMNTSSKVTAEYILNTYSEKELTNIFETYGELKNAQKISSQIVQFRRKKNIKTTADLIKLLNKNIQNRYNLKYLAKVFQALRIEVNKELDALTHMLKQSLSYLKKGGRLVVISYHSLEDRIVKNFLKNKNIKNNTFINQNCNGTKYFKEINKEIIKPTATEIRANNRSRSAKLRIAEKI